MGKLKKKIKMKIYENYNEWKNVNKKVITNADYIRSMSDEQLANWMSEAWNHTDYEEDDYDPYILAWLKTKRIEK